MYSRLDLMMMATTALRARQDDPFRWARLLLSLAERRTGLSTQECERRIEQLAEGVANG